MKDGALVDVPIAADGAMVDDVPAAGQRFHPDDGQGWAGKDSADFPDSRGDDCSAAASAWGPAGFQAADRGGCPVAGPDGFRVGHPAWGPVYSLVVDRGGYPVVVVRVYCPVAEHIR
jgi:hypothetical protein